MRLALQIILVRLATDDAGGAAHSRARIDFYMGPLTG